MATLRHEFTLLSKEEKSAYRNLLYCAMLDIRGLCQSRGPVSHNPFVVWRQYRSSRLAGALADWLHNLAQHAATDFNNFDTEWFWREYAGLCREYESLRPGQWLDYRERYDERLARLKAQ